MSWPILSVTIFLPLVGALLIVMIGGDGEPEKRNARWIALWTTLITFAISLILLYRFDPSSPEFQFVEKRPWLAGAITYHVGVDGISLPFLVQSRRCSWRAEWWPTRSPSAAAGAWSSP